MRLFAGFYIKKNLHGKSTESRRSGWRSVVGKRCTGSWNDHDLERIVKQSWFKGLGAAWGPGIDLCCIVGLDSRKVCAWKKNGHKWGLPLSHRQRNTHMSIKRIQLDDYVQGFQAFLTECTKYGAGEDAKIDYTAAPLWLLIVAVVFVLLFSSFERQNGGDADQVADPSAKIQSLLSWAPWQLHCFLFFRHRVLKKKKQKHLYNRKSVVCAHVRVSVWLPTRVTPYICTCVFRTMKPVGFFSPLIRGLIPSCQWCLLSVQTQHCTVLVPVAWLQSSHFCSHSTVA